MSSTPETRVWKYFIDAEGHFWHQGIEMNDPEMLFFFMSRMYSVPGNEFEVICQGETCRFRAEDVPHIIQSVEIYPDDIELYFPGSYKEKLDSKTLFVGKDHILYCRIRQNTLVARFNRKSYYEIAKLIEWDEKQKQFYLTLKNERHQIARHFL